MRCIKPLCNGSAEHSPLPKPKPRWWSRIIAPCRWKTAYASNGLSPAFIVAMEDFIAQSDVHHWVFGHTHYNQADGMQVGKCTMHTNQMGYVQYGVCDGFRPDAVFEV